ncbi:hypothetical protein GQ42DRAFT_173309 [Ramicandelaber brevisporus]|nr:hypothetical protein GQ42DRAFT_173309 [Ramicandelaber brevisporus]
MTVSNHGNGKGKTKAKATAMDNDSDYEPTGRIHASPPSTLRRSLRSAAQSSANKAGGSSALSAHSVQQQQKQQQQQQQQQQAVPSSSFNAAQQPQSASATPLTASLLNENPHGWINSEKQQRRSWDTKAHWSATEANNNGGCNDCVGDEIEQCFVYVDKSGYRLRAVEELQEHNDKCALCHYRRAHGYRTAAGTCGIHPRPSSSTAAESPGSSHLTDMGGGDNQQSISGEMEGNRETNLTRKRSQPDDRSMDDDGYTPDNEDEDGDDNDSSSNSSESDDGGDDQPDSASSSKEEDDDNVYDTAGLPLPLPTNGSTYLAVGCMLAISNSSNYWIHSEVGVEATELAPVNRGEIGAVCVAGLEWLETRLKEHEETLVEHNRRLLGLLEQPLRKEPPYGSNMVYSPTYLLSRADVNEMLNKCGSGREYLARPIQFWGDDTLITDRYSVGQYSFSFLGWPDNKGSRRPVPLGICNRDPGFDSKLLDVLQLMMDGYELTVDGRRYFVVSPCISTVADTVALNKDFGLPHFATFAGCRGCTETIKLPEEDSGDVVRLLIQPANYRTKEVCSLMEQLSNTALSMSKQQRTRVSSTQPAPPAMSVISQAANKAVDIDEGENDTGENVATAAGNGNDNNNGGTPEDRKNGKIVRQRFNQINNVNIGLPRTDEERRVFLNGLNKKQLEMISQSLFKSIPSADKAFLPTSAAFLQHQHGLSGYTTDILHVGNIGVCGLITNIILNSSIQNIHLGDLRPKRGRPSLKKPMPQQPRRPKQLTMEQWKILQICRTRVALIDHLIATGKLTCPETNQSIPTSSNLRSATGNIQYAFLKQMVDLLERCQQFGFEAAPEELQLVKLYVDINSNLHDLQPGVTIHEQALQIQRKMRKFVQLLVGLRNWCSPTSQHQPYKEHIKVTPKLHMFVHHVPEHFWKHGSFRHCTSQHFESTNKQLRTALKMSNSTVNPVLYGSIRYVRDYLYNIQLRCLKTTAAAAPPAAVVEENGDGDDDVDDVDDVDGEDDRG